MILSSMSVTTIAWITVIPNNLVKILCTISNLTYELQQDKCKKKNDAQAKPYIFIQYNYSMFYIIFLYSEIFIIRYSLCKNNVLWLEIEVILWARFVEHYIPYSYALIIFTMRDPGGRDRTQWVHSCTWGGSHVLLCMAKSVRCILAAITSHTR